MSLGQLQVEGCDGLGEMVRLGCPDDRGGHDRLAEHVDRRGQFRGQALLDLHAVCPGGTGAGGEVHDGVHASVRCDGRVQVATETELLEPASGLGQHGRLVQKISAFISAEHGACLNNRIA